eukprot:150809_1
MISTLHAKYMGVWRRLSDSSRGQFCSSRRSIQMERTALTPTGSSRRVAEQLSSDGFHFLHVKPLVFLKSHLYVYDTRIPKDKSIPFSTQPATPKSRSMKRSSNGATEFSTLRSGVTIRQKDFSNPTEMWMLPSAAVVNDISFSYSGRLMGTVQEDGMLRVFKFSSRQLLSSFQSYYGGLSCLSWSPDDKFILTGGEDDLVTLFNPHTFTVIARGQGHHSFVSGVAFDPEIKNNTYSFVSVAQDTRLRFWCFKDPNPEEKSHSENDHDENDGTDLNANSVIDSKPPKYRRKFSFNRKSRRQTLPQTPLRISPVDSQAETVVIIPAPPRHAVPTIQSESDHAVHRAPLASVCRVGRFLISMCDRYWVKIFHRAPNTADNTEATRRD